MMGITQNIALQMVRGDTLSLAFTIDGLSNDLDEVYFSCRTEFGTTSYVFQGSLTGGQVTKVSTGNYLVKIPPSYTASVTPGNYVYDMQLTYGSDIITPLIGKLKIIYGVTE